MVSFRNRRPPRVPPLFSFPFLSVEQQVGTAVSLQDKIDDFGALAVAWFISELAAVELALQGLTSYSIISMLPAGAETGVLAVVGIAGVAALADEADLI